MPLLYPRRRSAPASRALAPQAARPSSRRLREAERRRIGRELHDGLCQELFGAACELKVLARQAAAEGCRCTPYLEQAVEVLKGAMERSREAVYGLLAAEVAALGLVGALRSLAGQAGRSIPCEFRGPDGASTLSLACAGQLYRIAQEAVANALHHAGASRLLISLEETERQFTLLVQDNGAGLLGTPLHGARLGLKIMRQRAREIEARLEFQPAQGGGTRLICSGVKGGA